MSPPSLLKKVSVKGAPGLANNGVLRDFQAVEIDVLQVDHRYQRDLNQNLVEKILADWDFVASDIASISQREDGSLWIIDGQHRAAAAKLAGETEILAFVYVGLTIEEEADKRLKANNGRADSSLERFHAQHTAGKPETLAIVSLCEEFGTKVNRSMNKSSGINAVSCLETLYRVDGGLLLRETLLLLRDAYGEIQGTVATEPVLRGCAWFLRQHSREMSRADLRGRMSRDGVDEVLRKARSHKSAMGGSLWVNFYRALVEVYNHRRAEHNRLEWRTQHKHVIDSNDTPGRRGGGGRR